MPVDSDPQLWLDRDIMNIDHKRIVNVSVTHGEQTLEFSGKDGKLTLTKPAEHPPLEDYRVEDVARALETLTFQDVQPDRCPDRRSDRQGASSPPRTA